MNNPWEEISLDAYESHMSLDSVRQLQVLCDIMAEQLNDYDVSTVMVLGVAGGNGLEHIDAAKYTTVYCADINAGYLQAAAKRHKRLSGVAEYLHLDITTEYSRLPQAQLMTADLLIEYIGYEAFQRAAVQTEPEYVSCVIQINTDTEGWVSDSPYIHEFDRLNEVHHQMEEPALTEAMRKVGYYRILSRLYPLPNGKALQRIDYKKGRD